MSLKDLPLPSIASLRAIAALRSPHLALVRPARIGLGFESAGANQKTLLDVEDLLGGPGRLSLSYSLRWLLDVMTGLSVLHRTLSFVHGEVQPEHIVLGEDGVGRLLPVVRAHWVRGEERAPERLYYLAPEKLLGDNVDVRSDVYSIGVLLWEALAGQRMLEVNDVDDIMARLMSGGIPRAKAPEAESWTAPLTAVAERALAVDPGRRFATVAEMKDAIESACARYLASAPGMAELFENPTVRARNLGRESRPPDSQRVTLPPHIMPGSTPYASDEDALEAAAERLSRSSMSSIDLEDELTTHPKAAPPPALDVTKIAPMRAPQLEVTKVAPMPGEVTKVAPMPEVTKVAPKPHQSTLLGVPPPFVERDSSPPDELTIPRGRISIPPRAPVVLTPLPPVPAPLGKQPSMPPRSMTPPQSFAVHPSAQPMPEAHGGFARPASAPPQPLAERRAASLAPLVAAPVAYEPAAPIEPSFELVKPRKRRGALWLLLGAAVAAGIFAARPWLMQQVAAATGSAADTATENAEPAPTTPLVTTSATAAVGNADVAPAASSAPAAVGIASTPAAPSTPRGRGAAEEHIVIHDTVEPSLRELAHPTPVAPTPTPPPAAAPPPPPASPPPSPPPAAKPKEVPVSDADRYGI